MPTVHLTCPHCRGEFNYEFVPGVSVSAIRLGRSRYMACPLCHRWGTFPMTGNRVSARDAPVSAEGPETYSDRALIRRRGGWLLVPVAAILVSLLWIRTYSRFIFFFDIACLIALVVIATLLLVSSRLPATAPE